MPEVRAANPVGFIVPQPLHLHSRSCRTNGEDTPSQLIEYHGSDYSDNVIETLAHFRW